jgi:nucleotide-binding universal stress UspA family protein
VPTDGSVLSLKAVEMAINVSKAFNSELVFVHVLPTAVYLMPRSEQNKAMEIKNWTNPSADDEKVAKIYLQNALEKAEDAEVKSSAKLYRTTFSVREALCTVAKDLSAYMIVIGTRGTSAKRVIMGSVAAGVVTYAECPVLVVR